MLPKPLLLVLSLTLLLPAALPAAEPVKILLIGKDPDHPPRSHEYMFECELLAKCLRQTPGVEAVVSNGWPKDPAMLKDVKSIVMYTANGGDVLFVGKQRKQAEEMMKNGVGLAAIHFSVAAGEGEPGETFLHTLGGWFGFRFSVFGVTKSKLTAPDAAHPVLRGWKEYEFRDEYYWFLRFLPATKPLLTATINGKEFPVAWTFERPLTPNPSPPRGEGKKENGRSFGTVLGHFHDNFGDPMFRRLLVNGILWTAKVEIPKEGAPCEITAKEMELPPAPRVKK